MSIDPIRRLLNSSKAQVAFVAAVAMLVAALHSPPAESAAAWSAFANQILILGSILVASIAVEDASAKHGPINTLPPPPAAPSSVDDQLADAVTEATNKPKETP